MKFTTVAAVISALVASSAAADVLIDQQYVAPTVKSYYFDDPGDYMAQTFTVRNTGQITSVALQIATPHPPFPDDPLHFQLTRTNSAGEPVVADVLATYDISPTVLPHVFGGLPMVELDLRAQNVEVQAGEQLAIVLSSNDMHFDWSNSFSDQIPGGRFSVYSPRDFGPRWFSQWIINDPAQSWDAGYRITIDTIPEPSTPLLLALSALASIARRRRDRSQSWQRMAES